MLPEKTLAWGKSRSCIRELSEYGTVRKAQIGAENVFDFSLGNPSIPAPDCVNEAIADLIKGDSVALHGYTTAAGIPSLRQAIADDMNKRDNCGMVPERIYVSYGASAALALCAKAILLPGDEVIALAPFFPEYRLYAESNGCTLVTVQPDMSNFQIDYDNLRNALTEKTKMVIVNSPNNPSGVVLSAESITKMAEILREHEEKIGNTVYLIVDEPYRDLVYEDLEVPCMLNYYDDAIICSSFSKNMSIPGERMGYVAVSPRVKDSQEVYYSIMGAGRCLGYVNPPSLFQRVVERCIGKTADISKYKENRDVLCEGLKELGYEFIKPDGAFYLFVKAFEPDAKHFSEVAKKHELLLVPSDDFGVTGYIRIAYCVSLDMIRRSMPAFKALAEEYGVKSR